MWTAPHLIPSYEGSSTYDLSLFAPGYTSQPCPRAGTAPAAPAAVTTGSLHLWRPVTGLTRKVTVVCSCCNYCPLTTSGNVQTPPGKVLVESRHCRRVMGWPLS